MTKVSKIIAGTFWVFEYAQLSKIELRIIMKIF